MQHPVVPPLEPTYRATPKGEQLVRDLKEVRDWFTYRAPTEDQVIAMTNIRDMAREIAEYLVEAVAPSRERSTALTELRKAVMVLNQAVMWDRSADV